jgi:archaellum component FlaF (FlaF/FlaG flagellin family)
MTIDKVIVTVMLIIGGVVASFAIFNGVYPAVERSSEAISSAADTVNDRIKSQVEIIQVADSGTAVDAWIKNVGSSEINTIENSDVFFGPETSFSRIPWGNESSPLPYWSYQLEGGNSRWKQTVTTKITIHLVSSPAAGTYMLKVIVPNGIFDEVTFSVE